MIEHKKSPSGVTEMSTRNSSEHANKTNAIITGLFFIAATVSAIIGLKLYDPILNHADYLTNAARHSTQIIFGGLFELILVCTASGTAIMLFPYLRKYNESLAIGYVCFRVLEVVFILIGILGMLSIVTLGHAYLSKASSDIDTYQAAGTIAKAIHDWTFIIGPLFILGINTSIYNYVFYKSKLVPRPLSIWGITGAVLVFISSLLVMFGLIEILSLWQMLLAMPIAIYEMILAIWLITRGFNLKHLTK